MFIKFVPRLYEIKFEKLTFWGALSPVKNFLKKQIHSIFAFIFL
jgi:hypothetical protein